MKHLLTLSALSLGLLTTLTACPAAIVGAGAGGANLVTQDRTVGAGLDDTNIELKIGNAFFSEDFDNLYSETEIDVHERRVMLTGTVMTQELRDKAGELAWKVPGVKEVINEIQVENTSRLADYTRDAWIETQLTSRLLATKGIKSNNYYIQVYNKIVYILGVAQTEAEMRSVNGIASRTKYVEKVVSHIITRDDPRRAAVSQ